MNILRANRGRPPVSGARQTTAFSIIMVVLIAFQVGGQQLSSSTVGELLKQTKTNKRHDNNQGHEADCDYDKSKWTDCNETGVQERVLTLKRRQSREDSGRCEPVRTIRRDCKPVGCKYARGEWSAGCLDGKRVRVDTLVGAVGKSATGATAACRRERRVTKDCRRACHYIKSAWSECSNGVRTRNLTLDETPPANSSSGQRPDEPPPIGGLLVSLAPAGQRCARQKLVRRDCRPTPAPSTPAGRAARRRLKQKKQKEQQRQALADSASPTSNTATVTTTTTITPTTSTTPRGNRRR